MAVKAVIQASALTGTTAIAVSAAAEIEIRDEDGNIAALWEERAGTTPLANPFNADSEGWFQCYVTPGRYSVKATDAVTAAERTFADVVAQAREEPQLTQVVDWVQRIADISPQQELDGANVIVDFDTGLDVSSLVNSLLSITDAENVNKSGGAGTPAGWIKVRYNFRFQLQESAAAAETGDWAEIRVRLVIDDYIAQAESNGIFEAITSADNIWTVTGEGMIKIAVDESDYDVRLEANIQNRSGAGVTADISAGTSLTIERFADWAD